MTTRSTAHFAKLGLIPLLLGVLYCVFPRENKENTATDSTQQNVPQSVNSIATDAKRTSSRLDTVLKSKWPTIRAQDFVDLDPFDRRMIIPEIVVSAESTELSIPSRELLVSSESRSEREPIKVQAVFQSPKGIVAIVNDRLVQMGDLLEDGSKVIDITNEQIVLARKEIE